MIREWQHHDRPAQAVSAVAAAAQDNATADARHEGASWADITNAAGISWQPALQRREAVWEKAAEVDWEGRQRHYASNVFGPSRHP